MTHATRVFVLGAAVALVGCAGEPPKPADVPVPEISIGAQDFTFTVPDTVAGGLVRVHFGNTGKQGHHAQIIRLNDGVTYAQFDSVAQASLKAVATQGEGAVMTMFSVATAAGGPGPTAPGQQGDVMVDLAPGLYVLACFLADVDGVMHIAKGMTKHFVVTAAPAVAPTPPVATAMVDVSDFTFSKFPPMKAGKTLVELTNTGKEPHEMALVRLKGITADQFLAILSAPPPAPGGAPPPPPPFEFVTGLQGIMPGQKSWVYLDLTPGDYVALCGVPSPGNAGKPHFMLGMHKPFTVTS